MRPNGEIEITFEAIQKAFNLPDGVSIVANSSEIRDSLRGVVRLSIIDSGKRELPEGAMPQCVSVLTYQDVKQRDGMQDWHDGRYITARSFQDDNDQR